MAADRTAWRPARAPRRDLRCGFPRGEGAALTGEPPARVWVVSAEHWPRALLRGELIERGLDAVGFADAAHALRALTHPQLARPQLIVFDSSGADEASACALRGSGVPILLVAGAMEASLPWVAAGPWAALLRRPVSIDDVARAVLRLLPG